ncbi:amidase [Microdochium bolleyi]|uniref:Amidase n=1 Tax=Microdochium bolleyi TaxID=196109 RepID=A0A136JG32_9PEZI|nr:amidase [Microdochium bolleyi]
MSVLFTEVGESNPVKKGEAEKLLAEIGCEIAPCDSDDYHVLLAAVHDCAEQLEAMPDYQPMPDRKRYPRENIRLPSESEQEFGTAWAHKFLIRGAAASSSSGSRPPLTGKKVTLKDCIAVADVPQFYGSDAFPAWTPSTDATVVTRVLDAGADVHGTCVCEAFCNSTSSFTSAQGTIENPHRPGYSAGGSTSGGGALVGGGVMDIAIGTDQGGSIRVPSSLCGCVGFKPTHGLVPYTGITSGDFIDDHAGPIAKTVLDAAACLDALAGYDGIDDRSLGAAAHGTYKFYKSLQDFDTTTDRPLAGYKIGLLKEGFGHSISQSEVETLVRSAADKLAELGATVEEVSVPEHLHGSLIWTIQQRIAGAAGVLGTAHGRRGLYLTEFEHARLPWTADNFHKLFPSTKNTVINGMYLSKNFPGLYGKSVNVGRQIRDAYLSKLSGGGGGAGGQFDLIVMPTVPVVAPRHGTRDSPRTCFAPSIGLTSNTAVFNVTGLPALTLPVGFAPAQDDRSVALPVGMQIVGGLWQEDKILKAAYAWESKHDWRQINLTSQAVLKCFDMSLRFGTI